MNLSLLSNREVSMAGGVLAERYVSPWYSFGTDPLK
jgi:hypothetical protein